MSTIDYINTVRFFKHKPGAARLTVLAIHILKRRILGIFACLLFLLVRTLCVLFFVKQNPFHSAEKSAIWGVLRGG